MPEKKLSQELFQAVPDAPYQKPKKISTEEDLAIVIRVMQQEFDDAPGRVSLAQIILPDYAWWFILEAYLNEEKIAFTIEKNEKETMYRFADNYISVNQNGTYTNQINEHSRRPIELMLLQKGYKKSN